MSEKTGISWTDATFNPWWGCSKVSKACDHCYAERDAKRFAPGKVLWGVNAEHRTFSDQHWAAPRRWNDSAIRADRARAARGEAPGRRVRVFCASMGDWLDLDAPLADFVRLLDLIRTTPALDWLLLSKRIGNWRKRLEEARVEARCANHVDLHRWLAEWLDGRAPANVWIMATVVTQEEADRDITKLLAVPARVRGVSIEPMLGPITLPPMRCDRGSLPGPGGVGGVTCPDCDGHGCLRLHWVIAGGESGPHARPSHPDWFRSLRDQCAAAGVPFHFKQWGEWVPEDQQDINAWMASRDFSKPGPSTMHFHRFEDGKKTVKHGRAAAGRLLDGVEHNGFPGA